MKIDSTLNPVIRNEPKSTTDAKGKAPSETTKTEADQSSTANDVVKLSEHSMLVARSLELANGAPEVRQDKVDDIKARLAAGTYSVSGETVAQSILKNHITVV